MLPSLRSSGTRCGASILTLLVALGIAASAFAEQAPGQRQVLAAALRQVEALELLLAQSATSMSDDMDGRYHFDYPRVLADLASLYSGIQDYLTPSRAQPRDFHELAGDYRAEKGPAAMQSQVVP